MVGGDGAHLHADDILHIELDAFARKHPLFASQLTRHFISKRDALAFRRDEIIKLRRFFEQLGRACLRQLAVAKNHKSANGKLVVQRANRQITLTASDCHMIVRIHEVEPSFLPPGKTGQ